MTVGADTPLAPGLAAQLDQLRDIHLPPAISWWPPALGWWGLVGLAAALAVVFGVALRLRRRTVRYRALVELNALRGDDDLGVVRAAARVEVLMKRIVLQRDETRALAAEHGMRWTERLAQGPGAMPAGIARFIAMAPYTEAARVTDEPDRTNLFAAAEGWIRRNA